MGISYEDRVKLVTSKVQENRAAQTSYRREKTSESSSKDEKKKAISPIAGIFDRLTAKDSNGQSWLNKGLLDDGYDFGDISKTILGTAADVVEDLGTGVAEMPEKIMDAYGMIAPYHTKSLLYQAGIATMNPLILKSAKEYDIEAEKKKAGELVAKNLYDGRDVAHSILNPVTDAASAIVGRDYEDVSVLGDKADSTVQSGGQMLATAGLQAVGVPWFVTTGATSFGAEAENALSQGATHEQALGSAAISAAAEILTEKLSGGIKFGGKALDDVLTQRLVKSISNKLGRTALKWGLDVAGEAGEELLSEIASNAGSALYRLDEESWKEIMLSEEAMQGYLDALIGGGMMGGVSSGFKAINSARNGVDFTSGLTANEEAVVNKLYKDKLAEAQKSGKVSQTQKNQIWDDIVESMDKGEISTDKIEEILGGNTYSDYKKMMDIQEDTDFLSEYDKLVAKENASQADIDLISNMTERAKQITENRRNLHNRLRGEVSEMVKGDRLAESYVQRSLRGQTFNVDLSKYNDKQKAVYQKAIDSKVINNTRRSHEFVDLVAKIASDKDIDFDFTNNAKLKESGFAIESVQVNGYVNENGITINMDAHKAVQSVVGHEITHVLEGTELYSELQKAVFEYARSKGELTSRWKGVKALYEGKNNVEINKELAADLVGDYIFADSEFVNSLYSGNRNIFEKIYDEVKYLCKIVTAGSKEARQLEKVKKMFADAYRMESNGVSLNDTSHYNQKPAVAKEEPIAKTEPVREQQKVDDGKPAKAHPKAGPVKVQPKTETVTAKAETPKLKAEQPATVKAVEMASQKNIAPVKKTVTSQKTDTALGEQKGSQKAVGKLTFNYLRVAPQNSYLSNDGNGDYTMYDDGTIEPGDKVIGGLNEMNGWRDSGLFTLFEPVVDCKVMSTEGSLPGGYFTALQVEKRPVVKKVASTYKVEEKGRIVMSREGGTKYSLADDVPVAPVTFSNDYQTIRNFMKDDSSKNQYSLSSISNSFHGNADMTTDEFLQSDYKQTEGYKKYVDQCLKNMRQTRASFNEAAARKEIEDSIDGIIQVAIAAKQAGYDIYDDNAKRNVKDSKDRLLFSSLERNDEYFTSSDISTICDKRKNFAEIYDEIVTIEEAMEVPKGKRFFDNVDNYFALHKIMADKGLTQPCRQCYVESMRKNLAPMANAFLRLVGETNPDNLQNDQLYHQKGKQKGQQKVNNAALRESVLTLLDEYGMSASDLNVETLTTADGLAQLKIQAPMIYEAFNSFYGQSKPKMPKSATPFRFGELTALLTDEKGKIKQSLVNKINSTGGFRLQSYSDFQIQNYTDVLQVIYEAGTLGLNGHAYTKVPAFLDATKGTNLKRNISIFMYKDGDEWKLDRNDSFPYALDEIYDIVRSDRSGNTSIIAVSQNNDMSAWIMANDVVGYGIPFHKSGLKMGTVRDTDVKTEDGRIVKGYSGTKDHTRQQTEVWAKSNDKHKALTKVSKGIDIYEFWDFENEQNLPKNELIEKNLKKYIDECEKAGYLPKFRDYVMKNDKILNSVLEYSKKLGYADQNATIDDISFEYKEYRIPYGYYKFLGDFGMFTPDGKAAPQRQLSLRNYDFDQAVKFFSDSETLRRNEILQQFSNGEERQKYRDSNLTAEQLADIVKQRRREVAQGIVAQNNQKYSLSSIAPVRSDVNEGLRYDPILSEEFQSYDTLDKQNVDWEPVRTSASNDDVIENALKEKTGIKRFWAKTAAAVFDRGAVFEKLSLDTGNRRLMGMWNHTLSSNSRAQYMIGKGDPEKGISSLDSIREKAVSSGKAEAFHNYMYHQLNVDRMTLKKRLGINDKPVFGNNVSAEVSRKEIAEYERKNPEFVVWARETYDYVGNQLDMMVESGLITEATADEWRVRYPHYVPIHRDVEQDEIVAARSEHLDINAPIRTATGGNQKILPLFDTLAKHTMQTYDAVAKNNFSKELMKTLGTAMMQNDADTDSFVDFFDSQDELLRLALDKGRPTFEAYQDGVSYRYAITKEMQEALSPLDDKFKTTIKPLNFISNVRRGLITQYNPVFTLTNAIKDAQDVLLNSQHSAKTYAKMPEAYAQILQKGYWYNEYMKNGGNQHSYFNQNDGFDIEKKGAYKILDSAPLKAISAMNEVIETAPRLAEYIASREAGRSVEVSMLDAARVTTNFAAGGYLTKMIDRNGATFLNSSVQGAMQQVRNVREAYHNGFTGMMSLVTKTALAGLPAAILNGLIWEDDEDYEELADYVKESYYVVWKTDDGKFIRIPKGRMMAVIQSGVDQVMKYASGDDDADYKTFLRILSDNVAPNNPVTDNIFAPIVQVATNKAWYGDDLIPTRLQDLPVEEQFDEKTASISRVIGGKLGVSPYQVNYLLDQYSGAVGDVLLPMMTPKAETGDDSLLGNLIAPLKDKFTTDYEMNKQVVSDFFDTQKVLEEKAASPEATEKDLFVYRYMQSAGYDVADLYQKKRDIQTSKLPNSEKYKQAREIQTEINDIMQHAMDVYNDGNIKYNVSGVYAEVGDKRYNYSVDKDKWYEISADYDPYDYFKKEQEVTKALGISYEEYWNDRKEYNFKYDHPDLYNVSKAVGGYDYYSTFIYDLWDVDADYDKNGNSIRGSYYKNLKAFVNDLNLDSVQKDILIQSQYHYHKFNRRNVINYLNNRNDISYDEMKSICETLGMKVDDKGRITW